MTGEERLSEKSGERNIGMSFGLILDFLNIRKVLVNIRKVLVNIGFL